MNYVNLHLHDEHSLLDSCTKFKDYVDLAKKYGQTAIACTNHGRIFNWTAKKFMCDSAGIKYIHGCEVYLTSKLFFEDKNGELVKVRDNYHTILLAKNMDGVREINSLVSVSSTPDHIYYKPRISFDEFLATTDNIIRLPACLAGVLPRIDKEIKYLSELEKPNEIEVQRLKCLVDYRERLFNKYDYYELQPHNIPEQKEYNTFLFEEANKRGKKLVATNDVHNLNSYEAECREIRMRSKNITFNDGEFKLDLKFLSYEEFVSAFKEQGVIPENSYLQAIENTNEIADMCENFVLDTSIKYPKISDNDEQLLYDKIKEKFIQKVSTGVIPEHEVDEFKRRLEEECKVFKKVNMMTFMLSMSNIVCWAKEQGIPFGPSRGSCGGSCVAYVLDITDLDPVKWNTVFSRFCNEFRVEIGDIDVDIPECYRQKIFDYCINTFGQDKTAYVLALGTVSDKGCIDDIGRALGYDLSLVKTIKEQYLENPDKARNDYPDLFYYFDGTVNTCVSQSRHPAGIVISPITLADNYGTFCDSDGRVILQIDMEAIHDVGLAKYDLLCLRNIQTIDETYKLIGKKYPRMNEIDWDDQKVWESMLVSPFGIFQMESPFAFQTMKRFKPKSIFDMCLVTAMIRPSGESYREELVQHHIHKNPSKEIDDILKDSLGWLVYQEQIISFLQNICGLSGGEADNVRRAIGRKDKERLDKAIPSILEGYCKKSSKPREIAEQEAKEFLQVIEDASAYSFGYNHSIGYCLVGYLCAYLRYYYPIEFVTASFNTIKSQEDISECTNLAKMFRISINPPKFRYSRSDYFMDKSTNSIYKGLSSIKYLSDGTAEFLYNLGKNKYEYFIDLLADLETKYVNSRQLDILIKLDFFSEFGYSTQLLKIVEYYNTIGQAKQISKNKCDSVLEMIVRRYSRETAKKYVELNIKEIMKEIENYIKISTKNDATIQEKVNWQLEFTGTIDFKTGKQEDRTKLLILECMPLKKKKDGSVWAYRIKTISIGSGKVSELLILERIYSKNQIKVGDLIKTSTDGISKRDFASRTNWFLNKYVKI